MGGRDRGRGTSIEDFDVKRRLPGRWLCGVARGVVVSGMLASGELLLI